MSQSFVTDAGTLKRPGAYPTIKVQNSPSGLAVNGVLMIVGEADAGPDFTKETDLGSNSFGPSELSLVQSKYKSGNLVEAFAAAVAPMNDPDITGSFSLIVPVKTNPSTAASGTLLNYASATYGTLSDRSYGKTGNLINWQVTASQSEVVPNTGSFAIMLPIASTNSSVRVNGGAASALTHGALATPAAIIAQFDGVAGVDVTGGVSQIPVGAVAGTLALTVLTGNKVQIDYSIPFQGTVPSIGDTVFIPAASVLCTAAAANAGSYICTGSSASQILATKLLDVTGAHNALTPPVNRVAINVASTANDLQSYGQVTIKSVAGNPTDGLGKSLEINELTTGTGILSDIFWTNGTSAPAVATFISKTGAPKLVCSTAEYISKLNEARQLDSVNNSLTSGGDIALKLGYTGTTGQVVITATTATITVTGGSGSSPAAIALADFPTLADLAAYIGSLTGFNAAPGTAVIGSRPSTSLDQGTFTIGSTFGGAPGRIKMDSYDFYNDVTNDAVLVKLNTRATAGLPAPTAGIAFLAGGAKGATTDSIFNAAINALKLVRGNFVIPLFSRDAASDIADNLTDTSSTYTIANVHAQTRSHILQMRTLKARRNRQAFLSIRDTFANCQTAGANMGSAYISMSFQDVKDASTQNGVVQFQPWMEAVTAASAQAAGFYKPIFNKLVNCSGALQAAGDFNDQDDDEVDRALDAGLLILARDENGQFRFVSDQTTYGKDNNPIYNSIQAVYVSDVVALSTAQLMEKAFVGQSIADISASLASTTLDGIMGQMRRLKLIAKSDDAPSGYKNVKIVITGPAMVVSLEIKVAGAIYFIPITFTVTQVQQSA